MKKKLFLFVFAIAMVITSVAQHNVNYTHHPGEKVVKKDVGTTSPAKWAMSSREELFYEDFSDNGLDDWTIMGEGADNWVSSNTNTAGGEAPQAVMVYSPIFLGTSRLVSPIINTSGNTELSLSFFHLVDSWSGGGGFWVGVETTSDGGATWNPVWELFWDSPDDLNEFKVLELTTDDVGSEDFQFCFYFKDNSDLLDAWAIDNVLVGSPISYDVTPSDILGLDQLFYEGDNVAVSAQVDNYGLETVSFDVLLEIDNGSEVIHTSTKTVTDLAFGENQIVDFDEFSPALVGAYTATVTTLLANDEVTGNDINTQSYSVLPEEWYCIPGGDCSYGDGIIDFAFAGIENYGSGCSPAGYGVFTHLTANVEIGSTYSATLASGYSSNYVSIWIDFNNDLEFQSYERILTDFALGDGSMTEVDITIPGNGFPGTTTMRVGSVYGGPSSPDPCASPTYAEWEDYTIVVTGTSVNLDAGVASVNMAPAYGQGDITPKATVANYGIDIISFPVTCNIPGTSYTSTKDVTDLGLGESIEVEFDNWAAVPGSYNIEVSTALTDDEIPENDSLSMQVSVVEFAPTKMVVGEEGTGTWCGWCTRGTVYMDSMAMKFPETWIGIAVHNGDPMVVSEYDAGIGTYISGYPGGVVDRTIVTDPSNFEAAYNERLSAVAPAELSIENISLNETTRELAFSVSAQFVMPVSDFRLNAVIIENGVTGTGDGWAQANYYSGGGNGPMGGYEDLPNPVPAEMMVYDHVGRAILGGFEGAEGSLPASVNAGETHSYEFSITLEEDWDMEHIEMVGILVNSVTGSIENGTIEELLVTDINESAANQNLVLYPNPAKNAFKISNVNNGDVYVYAMNGQLLVEQHEVNGSTSIDISNFMNGTYIVRIIMNDQAYTSKLNIIK